MIQTRLWSDLHLSHLNSRGTGIIDYSKRPFLTIDEMDQALIQAWQTVGKDDILINLGDFVFKWSQGKIKDLLSRMPGYKILVLGNHDKRNSLKWWYETGFDEVYPYPIIYRSKYILSHEPIILEDSSPFTNIHGHVHNTQSMIDKLNPKKNINCSVEVIGYKPILWEDLIGVKK